MRKAQVALMIAAILLIVIIPVLYTLSLPFDDSKSLTWKYDGKLDFLCAIYQKIFPNLLLQKYTAGCDCRSDGCHVRHVFHSQQDDNRKVHISDGSHDKQNPPRARNYVPFVVDQGQRKAREVMPRLDIRRRLILPSTESSISVEAPQTTISVQIPDVEGLPVGFCQGRCSGNIDCEIGLVCQNSQEAGDRASQCNLTEFLQDYSFMTCITAPFNTLVVYGTNITKDRMPLGACQGYCEENSDCANGLYCFHPESKTGTVPGCLGDELVAKQGGNFCVKAAPGTLIHYSGDPPSYLFPLGPCQGDCDQDSDCQEGLVCFQRGANVTVPGCFGGEEETTLTDYCIVPPPTPPPYFLPTPPPGVVTYQPGNLTTLKDNLLLSEGLDSKLIATSGQFVQYHNGSESLIRFQGRPDAGATFHDTREGNPGGWVYVMNSEMYEEGAGGVGAITFDRDGNITDYRMVLEGTTHNCGGGRTPWNTWVSCEERPHGKIYQVDPIGNKLGQETTMGSIGGVWESFAYYVPNLGVPRFFVTEDSEAGALVRFTPSNPDWGDEWNLLHNPGYTDYLMLYPTTSDNSTGNFLWTSNRTNAKRNAREHYPGTEGIDVYNGVLYFVSKVQKMLYMLNLESGNYNRYSTVYGLFTGTPDQFVQLTNNDGSTLVYMTEESPTDSGVHARDLQGRYTTILESPVLPGEVVGLAFSPDLRFMYMGYQKVGIVYAIWRRDGLPFDATHLDL